MIENIPPNDVVTDAYVLFFQNLIQKLRDRSLPGDQLRRVSEFFMRETMIEHISQQTDEEQMMKYFTLGWFVYEQLLRS